MGDKIQRFYSISVVLYLAGDISPEVIKLLRSMGHEDIKNLPTDPVRVNIVAERNEDVAGYADVTRDSLAGAVVY